VAVTVLFDKALFTHKYRNYLSPYSCSTRPRVLLIIARCCCSPLHDRSARRHPILIKLHLDYDQTPAPEARQQHPFLGPRHAAAPAQDDQCDVSDPESLVPPRASSAASYPLAWGLSTAKLARMTPCICAIRRDVCTSHPAAAILARNANMQQVSVASLNITNARNRTLLNITPNAFPATRYSARREFGDDSVIDYIQVQVSETPCGWRC
jgi:hypothetical protein